MLVKCTVCDRRSTLWYNVIILIVNLLKTNRSLSTCWRLQLLSQNDNGVCFRATKTMESIYSSTHLNLGPRLMTMLSFELRQHYIQVTRTLYPLNMRFSGLQRRCGRLEEEKPLSPLPGIKSRSPGRPNRSLVTLPTELYRQFFFLETWQIEVNIYQ